MPLTLNTLDRAYNDPDAATVAKTLAGLDGARNLVATLARGEATYVQATGGAASGLVLIYQDGSLRHRYRSAEKLSLARVTEVFEQFLRGDGAWREGIRWEEDVEKLAVTSWYESWWFYIGALVVVIAGFVWWRGWY